MTEPEDTGKTHLLVLAAKALAESSTYTRKL